MITLENKSSKSLKISNRLLLSLLASFITSFLLGIKSSVFIREVVFTDDVLKPSVFENEVHLKNELTPDDEDSDDEDSNDDEEVSLNDYDDDDEEIEDEEEIQRLYEVTGMSHQVVGTINGIKQDFLAKDEGLMNLIKLVGKSLSLELLSLHCSTSTMMKSCTGITTERGSVSMYTNPNTNRLVFNVLSGGKQQVNVETASITLLEKEMLKYYLQTVVTSTDGKAYFNDEPAFNWRMRLRNFPDNIFRIRNPYFQDLSDERFLENTGAIKKHIDTIETPFQRIDVYDFVDRKHTSHGSHMRSHNSNYKSGDSELMVYEKKHPELFEANRVIFLDGVLQSLSRGNEAYHEALVQPAMFAHPNPKRVAIVGGGEGATLREALKHKSVDKVLMIDIDEIMCKESARLLYPKWNSCDDFENTAAASCFDDPRADVRYEDALAFFISRFNSTIKNNQNEKLDVIIMDALDPQDQIPFAEILYQDYVYWESLYNALTDDGILVAQLGDAPEIGDPAEDYNEQKNRVLVLKTLQAIGFVSMHVYEESHCEFGDPWTFLIACKSINCRKNWYRSSAEIDLDIHKRVLRSKSGAPLLKYFDGNTMSNYHNPPKATETVYCRSEPTPKECLFDRELKNQIGTNKPTSLVRVSSQTKQTLYKYLQGKTTSNYLSPLQTYAKLYAKKGSIRKMNMYRDNYDHYEFYLKTNVVLENNNDFMNDTISHFNITMNDIFMMNNLTMDFHWNGNETYKNSSFASNKENPFDYISSYSPIVDRHHYLYASFL